MYRPADMGGKAHLAFWFTLVFSLYVPLDQRLRILGISSFPPLITPLTKYPLDVLNQHMGRK